MKIQLPLILALALAWPFAPAAEASPGPAVQQPEHDHDGDGTPDHESHEEPLPAPAVPDTGPRPGKPRLDVDQPEHDFGSAIEGERLTHVFKLTSSGDADLVINSAKPTCGCTVAKIAVLDSAGNQTAYEMGNPIPAGTSLELTARLDTKNKHNVASSKINIFCNDPRQTVTLGLKAMVDTYFNVNPSALSFGEVSLSDVVTKSLTVSGKQPGPFKLNLEGRTTPPGMKIELRPENPDAEGRAEQWHVDVTIGPDAREGNLGFPVQLQSDEEVKGAPKVDGGEVPHYGVTAMVTAQVRGPISWEPQYISFGLVRPGQVMPRTMRVETFDPEFKFDADTLSLEVVGPSKEKPEFPWKDYFSHVVRPSEDGKAIDVELTLDGLPEDAEGSFQGQLLIKTGHPAKPEIGVLFSGVCRLGVNNVGAKK
jgi:hypothetical protein